MENNLTISTLGGLVHNTSAKKIPSINDMLPLMDSQDKNLIKKISMTDLFNGMDPTTILDKLKTVDGEGSGLDADLLDGNDSATFVKFIDFNNNVKTFRNWGGLYTGSATNNGAIRIDIGSHNIMFDAVIRIRSYTYLMDINVGGYTYTSGGSDWHNPQASGMNDTNLIIPIKFYSDGTNRFIIIGDTTTVWGGYLHVSVDKVDIGYGSTAPIIAPFTVSLVTSITGTLNATRYINGAGSGLDADTVDGKHANAFLELAGGTMSGALDMSNNDLNFRAPALDGGDIVWWENLTTEQHRIWGATGVTNGLHYRYKGGATQTLWASGNDGAGSGLDADLLDGLHASAFAQLSAVYPVGAIYLSTVATNPATLFGFGTWVAIAGRFLIGADGTYPAGSTGGGATHVHAMPHTHTIAHTHNQGTLETLMCPTTSGIAYQNSTVSFSANRFFNVSGATDVSSTSSRSYGVGISGNTGASSAGSSGGVSTANTGSGSSLPPYLSVYIWQRTA
jgi:hypothetical protein